MSEQMGEPLATREELAPDEMAEIPRELTMLRGAVSSLHSVANDLIGKISPTVRNTPEDDAAKITEIPTKFPVNTEVGKALRDACDEVSTIEHKIARAYHRSGL